MYDEIPFALDKVSEYPVLGAVFSPKIVAFLGQGPSATVLPVDLIEHLPNRTDQC